LGGGSDAKLVKAGAVVLVPLGFAGAALAYAGLRGAALRHVLPPAREGGGKSTSTREEGTLPYEEGERAAGGAYGGGWDFAL